MPEVMNMQEVVRKKKSRTLASRVEALEAEIAEMKQLTQQIAAKSVQQQLVGHDWKSTFGQFKDDPGYDEVVRLGRAYRRRQPKC